MTGRDLIIYIMTHGLEDEPVFKDGTLIGFMTEQKFAEKMNVGTSTVHAWIELGYLSDTIRVGDTILIPMNCTKWNLLHAFGTPTQKERGQ